jgi:hypothetical protein
MLLRGRNVCFVIKSVNVWHAAHACGTYPCMHWRASKYLAPGGGVLLFKALYMQFSQRACLQFCDTTGCSSGDHTFEWLSGCLEQIRAWVHAGPVLACHPCPCAMCKPAVGLYCGGQKAGLMCWTYGLCTVMCHTYKMLFFSAWPRSSPLGPSTAYACAWRCVHIVCWAPEHVLCVHSDPPDGVVMPCSLHDYWLGCYPCVVAWMPRARYASRMVGRGSSFRELQTCDGAPYTGLAVGCTRRSQRWSR